jgi:RecJ-like exonuclease
MELLFDDECMAALLPQIEACAAKIRGWIGEGRMLCVRFNDDCDGVAAGMEIYASARAYAREKRIPEENVTGFQVPSAVYGKRDAYDDVLRARDRGLPLAVVICDLGANAESVEGLQSLRDSGAKVCIIDHHPPSEDARALCDAFVTSHTYDNSGAHTAGLVAYEVARRVSAGAANKEWVYWSLQSDKSTLASGDYPAAKALDYLAHFSEAAVAIEDYYEKVTDGHMLRLATDLAIKGEQKALEIMKNHAVAKKVGKDALLIVADMSKATSKTSYPPKGRALNLVQDYYCAKYPDKAIVSMGYSDDSISIRANARAREAGFDSNPVIGALKDELPHAIRSGGGHSAAANVRVEPEFCESVRRRMEELIARALEEK